MAVSYKRASLVTLGKSFIGRVGDLDGMPTWIFSVFVSSHFLIFPLPFHFGKTRSPFREMATPRGFRKCLGPFVVPGRFANLSFHQPAVLSTRSSLNIFASGNTDWRGRISTVDLLFKIACFVTMVNNIFNKKSSWSKLVRSRRSTVLSLPVR